MRHSNFLAVLQAQSKARPNQRAFTFLTNGDVSGPQVTLTFEELDLKARSIAARLREQGCTPGSSALLLYPSSLDFICAFFGCLYANLMPVPTVLPEASR